MTIRSSFARSFGGTAFPYDAHVTTRIEPVEWPAAELYRLLKAAYATNGFYDDMASANVALGRANAQTKAIRSPIVPVVRFFGAKTYPSPLTIETEKPAIVAPIEQVWKWSNWRAKAPMYARWSALYGEAWVKVQADQERGRVWFEYLEPAYVTAFEEDPRGFVQYVRIDIPDVRDDGKRITHTEVWSTAEQRYRIWETDGDASGRKLSDLGAPIDETAYATLAIDFTPFVRTPFSDDGEKRGTGAVQLALEAIVEADLSATNLHSMVYVDAEGAWVATAPGMDASGRPIPPLTVGAATPTFDSLGRQNGNGTGTQSDGSISVGKRSFWRLPGGYDLKSVVANIDFAGALAILKDHDEVLERLMPALAYARISEMSGADLSGVAMSRKLLPAIDQLAEVRATALEKLAQQDAMALTLGKVNGIPGFDAVGDFDAGDFEHGFKDVEIIAASDMEQAQAEAQQAQAFAAWIAAGLPMAEALRRVGYTDKDAAAIVDMVATEADEAAQRQQDAFGGDQGGQPFGQGQPGQGAA